jgi:ribosomal protein L7/L12
LISLTAIRSLPAARRAQGGSRYFHSSEGSVMSGYSEAIAYLSVVVLLLVFLVFLVHQRLASIEKRVGRLSRLEVKIDLLLKQAGVEYEPYKNLPSDVVDALRRGNKIQAIKHYREATGIGLKEAKDFIEDVQRRAGDTS